ncbi:CUB and zona pellucida-like domain-containing protein 1 isoform X5 [Misgurnus anguillicaudatus]|uniref:CUB and zona pellucida-like domain-containing protein 1 isoform X3 n=1 Tax=Misgurnus anguillicaudatus TaxID=75329 RepID=UPI003CCF7273
MTTAAPSSTTSDWEWTASPNPTIDWEWTGYNGCGGNMANWMGEFVSPQYPSFYPNGARCTWTIHSTGQRTVLLNFTFVDLETCCDYIEVFDGHTSRGRLLGKVQGNRRQSFKSTQNGVTVVFYSDGSETRRGFHANWVFVDSNSCRYNCGYRFRTCSCENSCRYKRNCCHDYKRYCPVASTSQPAMTTAAPRSPTSDWEWTASSIATSDWTASSSATSDWTAIGNATIDREWTATSNATVDRELTATSNATVDREWTGYNGCGGNMENWMGEFVSPQYPSFYPNGARCTWTIHSTGQRTVLLNFTFVDLETCCDYIEVFDGHTSRGRLLGKLRENRRQSFKSTQNDMTVVFYSDHSVTRKGFHANWVFVDSNSCRYSCGYQLRTCSCEKSCQYERNCCHDYNRYCLVDSTLQPAMTNGYKCGGHLYGSGQFFSPNYPNYYYNNSNCVWYLSAQPGQKIVLSFANVQLENCCTCDYISVHDGSSTGYPELGKICFNDTTQQTFHSSSQYMTVVFRSDYSGVSHGFKAMFTSSLTADKGRVDCSSDNMVIVIQLSYLNSLGFNGNNLYVDDHQCRPTITSTEVVFSFPFNTCGSGREMMNGFVTYTNNVRASESQSDEITRKSQFLLRVGCRMEPETMVQILYKTRNVTLNANIMGTGHFNASMAFYNSSSFNQIMYDSPYEVTLNQSLYVQVQLNRADRSLNLFLDTCVASPDQNDFQARSYYLLRNGCSRDSTYYSYINGQQYYARFHFKAFKFLRTQASVYLQCKVIICPDNDYNSWCRQGCRQRRKRSLESNHYTNTVILGPIKLRDQKVEGLV